MRSSKHQKNRKKRTAILIESDKQVCKSCEASKKKTEFMEGSKYCKECKINQQNYTQQVSGLRKALKLERIKTNNCFCEKCDLIHLTPISENQGTRKFKIEKEENGNFVEFDGTKYTVEDFLQIHQDHLELRILQFDHLPEEDQRNQGILADNAIYEPKEKIVGEWKTMEGMQKESKKCQLICCLCHIKETIKREKGGTKRTGVMLQKKQYADKIKMGGCQICKFIDVNLLRFFDLDHIDKANKLIDIAHMISDKNYSLEDVIKECAKCRVLCKHCHFIHTDLQRKKYGKLFFEKRVKT
jgi:hypothetical protein